MAVETTLVLVKPDGVRRSLCGEVVLRLERRGYELRGARLLKIPRSLAQRHYAIHEGKPFYAGLIDYITSSPVAVAVFEGKDAVAVVRSTVGATNPTSAAPGTIRGDWALEIGRNLVHASDAPETGETEVALWFRADELVAWQRDTERWIAE